MDGQQFLAGFGYIANAPGGVARLRELVLQLAISGRLVERGGSETLVVDSLAAAAKLRKEYEARFSLRASRPQPPIQLSPFVIPSHWKWLRLEQLSLYVQRGKGPKYAESGNVYVVSQKCVQWSGFDLRHARFIADEAVASYGYERFLIEGDLLWNSTGTGTAGRIAIYTGASAERVVADSHVTVIRLANALPGYIWCVIASPWVQARIQPSHPDSLVSGTTQQVELATRTVRALAIPFPPLDEQARIVAKVDELMALCDQLEEQQQQRRKMQNALRQSTLQAVASAQSPHELQATWARVSDSFGQLFSAPEDVEDLRKSVSDLAASGYLSEPHREDEPASALLSRILTAKKKGISEGSMVRKRHVKAERLQDSSLPLHWESITLDDAISTIDAGWSPACLPRPREDESKWGVLKTTAVQSLRFAPSENKELPASLDPRPQYQVRVGDILITRAGPKNRVGVCCVVDDAPPRLMISDKLIRFHIVDDLIDARFVALCLSAGESGRAIERLKSGMADSQMNISQDKLRAVTIPLPPLAEQRRILERVEGVMRIIVSFEEYLRGKAKLGEKLTSAAVSSLTGVAIENKEEPVKAPETELVAPLRLGQAPEIKSQAPLATILARHSGEMSAKDLWERFGSEVDVFYSQLKTEVAHGWIQEPEPAQMREVLTTADGA